MLFQQMTQKKYVPAAELLMVTYFLKWSSFHIAHSSLVHQPQSILTNSKALQSCSVHATNSFYMRREKDLLRQWNEATTPIFFIGPWGRFPSRARRGTAALGSAAPWWPEGTWPRRAAPALPEGPVLPQFAERVCNTVLKLKRAAERLNYPRGLKHGKTWRGGRGGGVWK